MGMVVHPGPPSHNVRDVSCLIEERRTIFAKKHESLVKKEVVDPTNLASRAVVWDISGPASAIIRIDWNARSIKHVNEGFKLRYGPPRR